jgi:mono/diheme cytochrome c family protein
MKKSVKKAALLFSTIAFAVFVMSFINPLKTDKQDGKEWIVPEAAKKMKNPTTASEENIKAGKALFAQHCKSCHGATGKGDGPKSGELDTPSGDFTTKEFQSQTDGSLFYKTKEGRVDMPSFKKKISEDEDIWLMVDYIRTLAAK